MAVATIFYQDQRSSSSRRAIVIILVKGGRTLLGAERKILDANLIYKYELEKL